MESIVQDLRGLSLRQLVEVARYVHRLNPAAATQRESILNESHGYLEESEAAAFEEALEGSRRLEGDG
jgi:hypothetical protein